MIRRTLYFIVKGTKLEALQSTCHGTTHTIWNACALFPVFQHSAASLNLDEVRINLKKSGKVCLSCQRVRSLNHRCMLPIANTF